jgi:hypothetical protein
MRTNTIVRNTLTAALLAASMPAVAQSTSPDARAGSVIVETQKPKPRTQGATNQGPQQVIVVVGGKGTGTPVKTPPATTPATPNPPGKATTAVP